MEITLYDPAVNSDIYETGFIAYAQVPIFPVYPEPPFNLGTQVYVGIQDLSAIAPPPGLSGLISALPQGTFLTTNGSIFDNVPGYNALAFLNADGDVSGLTPTSFFDANANTGYAGFTNYTINFDDIDLDNLSLLDLPNLGNLLSFEPVNPNFPVLDPAAGFTIAFDLTLLQESSAPNRAGFSIIAVSNDPSKEIEIGFKTAGADRAVALSSNFVEAENSSATALDFSRTQTYWLSMLGDRYSLAANGVEILAGNLRNYNFNPAASDPPLPTTANPYALPNFLFWGDNTDQANASFVLGEISILPLQTTLTNDLVDDYIASYRDLIRAFGYNLEAGKAHYLAAGFKEGREVDRFEEDIYLASYGDLIRAFGYDLDAATRHYIQFGAAEGRSPKRFLPEVYLNGYADLKRAFGDDLKAATRHYIQFGFAEGRDPLAGFNGGAYIASYNDLITAFGYDPQAGRRHYLLAGYEEGREITFEADDYIASYGDLIRKIGYNLEAGIQHFVTFGAREGRARDSFDEVAYLNKYADLQRAFGDDVEAATRHYIQFGFAEGRTDA